MQKVLRKSKLIPITVLLIAILTSFSFAQSTDQNFPTPVRSNEITGVIKARDVGDSRLTSHFYTFEGGQGDVFINVQTSNFSGDVDVFAVPGLRPLTKMVVYADASVSETGRVIYLRKPETIVLRVTGRTPGDEEATYRIKFAGSFIASNATETAPELPKVESETQSNVRVNSVGTIIEVIPKATPAPKEEPAPVPDETVADAPRKQEEKDSTDSARKTVEPNPEERPAKPEVVVTDPIAERDAKAGNKEEPAKTPPRRKSRSNRNNRTEAAKRDEPDVKLTEEKEAVIGKDASAPEGEAAEESKKSKKDREKAPDPMAGIRLVIRFKNGGVIERPMTEVSKFTVERAVLTVVSKDGSVGRYQMIEVIGVTIE